VTQTDLGIGRALVVGTRDIGRCVIDALREVRVGVAAVDDDAAMLLGLPHEVEALHLTDARPLLARVDVVIVSRRTAELPSLLAAAVEADVPVWSEPEFAARLRPDRRIVAITGGDGAAAMTERVIATLTASGVPAAACGGMGLTMLEAALSAGDEALVVHLTPFQLRYADRLRARVGALLELEPVRLDLDGGFEAYGAAKAQAWMGQDDEDLAVGPVRDDSQHHRSNAATAGGAV
jgi:UDP-N-acetylmuramoylalanine--D-glutamate ligase